MGANTQERRHFKAKIKWPVIVQPSNGAMEGVTLDLSSTGTFIRCRKPLRLNEVFDMLVNVPALGRPLKITAEVVWSNIYGPDDEITPRGMGARFVKISGLPMSLKSSINSRIPLADTTEYIQPIYESVSFLINCECTITGIGL